MIHMPKVLSGAIICLLQLAFTGQIVWAEVVPYPRAVGSRANLDFPSVRVDGVVFENLMIAGKKRTTLADAEITTNSFVRNVSFSLGMK